MRKNIHYLPFLISIFLLSSCSTGNHGTFVNSTFIPPGVEKNGEFIGKVSGESAQLWLLYMFPIGDSPTTDNALSDAKGKYEGIKYLTDVSIDDKKYWGIGYSSQIIKVEANAYK